MKVIKAEVMGFCEGVKLAIQKTIKAREEIDGDMYLLGNLVHNEQLMQDIKSLNINIVKDGSLKEKIEKINNGTIIFSAHGHDEKLDELARNKGLKVISTTCPRVKLTINKIKEEIENNNTIIYIGIKGHPEANAILSISDKIIFIDYKNVNIPTLNISSPHVFNQTTLSLFELSSIHEKIKEKYKNPIIHNDICTATTKRQNALLNIDDSINYVLIIGDKLSSNTLRLFELCKNKYANKEILFVSCLEELLEYKLDNKESIFVTAGASTPDNIIEPIINYLSNL